MNNKVISVSMETLQEASLAALALHCPLCGVIGKSNHCPGCDFTWENDKYYFGSTDTFDDWSGK